MLTVSRSKYPSGNDTVAIAQKPDKFREDGNSFFRISDVGQQQFQLKAGKRGQVNFVKPD